MSEILSQAEIEALLSSLGGDAAPAPGPERGQSAPIGGHSTAPASSAANPFGSYQVTRSNTNALAYEVYDFRRQDKFSKDQLRTLQMLHETFARLASTSLSAYLRTPVSFELISLEQVPYEEYLRSIGQSVFTITSIPPLTGQAVLEIEFGLVFTVIDRLLGGPGKSINRTVLTDIERPLIRNTVERMFSALRSAWEGVVIVNPGIEALETSAQFVQIAPPSDIVVTILFEVKIGNQRGALSICIPYLVLKPVTAKLSAQKWFSSGTKKTNTSNRRSLSNHIQQTALPCVIQLGRAKITIKEFLDLKVGDMVRLDQSSSRDVPLLVNSVPKFKGRPALEGSHLVFSVTGAAQ